MCRISDFKPNNAYPAYKLITCPQMDFNNAALSMNICKAQYTKPHYHVQVAPVRLNYLEQG